MMRVYSSILMSSLLLSAGAVNAQSLETRSTFFAQDNSVPEILTAVAETQTFYADNNDPTTPPPRGGGR
ncbi:MULTISPECIES: heterocyst-inhibiting protein PatX [unclassified Microcoleus]|uniref:heterocyst-inhibiting protein PatX n=1 Tax=unclassified Microcoleus TaxID=2642155 RepID=UPI002FD2F433